MIIRKLKNKYHPAEQYALDVISGRIVTCKLVKKACERYFYDLKHQKEKGIYFDKYSALKVIEFIETYCRHWEGEWAGNKFELADWQLFIIWNVFGWKIGDKDGSRRFKTVYLEVGRKNGKTTLLAAIALYMFVADGEQGAQIYSAAVKKDQAMICHNAAKKMVKASPELKGHIYSLRHNLSIQSTNSKFEPLGRDSDSCDGLNIHCAIVDELHAHKTADMWNVLQTATGSRKQPLQIAITTAGFDRNTVCWEQHEYLVKILNEVGVPNGYFDDSYFGMIYTVDDKDDWKDESCYIKANPNLGISKYIEKIREEAKKAREIPSEQNEFLRKHLCKWVQQSVRAIDMDVWDQNFSHNIIEESLYTRQCFGGLDLSSVSDLTAWVMVFPTIDGSGNLDIISRFWCPEAQISNRQNRYRHFYEAWSREGWLDVTPGDAIDYERVKHKILEDVKKFNIIDMAVDRMFQGYQLSMELSDEMGTRYNPQTGKHEERVIAISMSWQQIAPAMLEFEKRLLGRYLNHGHNPIMRFCADNLAVSIDSNGNKRPDKAASQGKIDGIVALVMALDRLSRQPIHDTGSKYEREDMVVV